LILDLAFLSEPSQEVSDFIFFLRLVQSALEPLSFELSGLNELQELRNGSVNPRITEWFPFGEPSVNLR
jgi:hypothetical protein